MTEGEIDNSELFLQHLKHVQCKESLMEKENIRDFVSFLRRSKNETIRQNLSRNIDLVNLIVEVLASGTLHRENQVFLSNALCILMKRALEDEACDVILCECITFDSSLLLPSFCGSPGALIAINNPDLFRVCLTWSALQCFGTESLNKFYSSHLDGMEDKKVSPFIFVFDILEKHCNSFTNATYMSFKLMPAWLSRLEKLFTLNLIGESNLIFYFKKAFVIVSYNWENSVAGVRERNVEILKKVFGVLTKTRLCATFQNDLLILPKFSEIVMLEVPWRMKCKYFILASILNVHGVKEVLIKFPNLPSGLIYSLSFPHLVSAGSDCYRELIKEITVDEWIKSFYWPLKNVMIGEDRIAKDNLMSYWMPETVKAFPLLIHEVLSDLLHDINSSSLFSVIALFKIGRRFGLLKWKQMDGELLKKCVSHISEDIRGKAFAVACINTMATTFPTQDEIDMVCLFLEENVNVDSAQLRHVTVTFFKIFVCHLKSVYHCHCMGNESMRGKAVCETEKIVVFFNWLLRFIMENFVPGVNYQRRITSLYLLRIVLDNICSEGISQSHPLLLKSSELVGGEHWLKNEVGRGFKGSDVLNILLRCLMDSVADIRDEASGILKRHFDPPSEEVFHSLWEKALSMCCSSMFYEIESGAVLAECLIHWRLCEKTSTVSVKTIPYVDILLGYAEEQKAKLEENLLGGAAHAPVHGILNVLHRIVSSPDILARLELKEAQAKRLLHFVDNLIRFALGVLSSKPDVELDVAPSFAEMGIAIDSAINENARCLDDIGINELSGAPALVLNCIWLNLKVCCQLSSALATNLNQNKWGPLIGEDDVEYCGHLMIRVLMKCRHKGAIESAGKSLSTFAVFCASNPNPKLKDFPLRMLSNCLEQTIGRRDGRASITRCSAGLSILVQKLIVADGKNTIPMCIPKLLSWIEMDYLPEFCNAETEDLPQTQALHFLRAIVQDSAVYQYVSPYMSEIALACFKNFSSGVWAIRNAALQLFGAVVPKLIGQKKGQEEDMVGSNVSLEELNTHYPELLDYMLKKLKESVINLSQDVTLTSPNLLPILILCSRLTLGIPQLHTESFSQLLLDFQHQFHSLLSSPNMAVRKSCAKAISAFTPLTQMVEKVEAIIVNLIEGCPISNNELHGKLLCIKFLKEKLEVDYHLLEEHKIKYEKVQRLMENESISRKLANRCYFTRALLCEIQGFTDCYMHTIIKTVKEKSPQGCYPGMLLWAATSLECLILTCSGESLYHILQGCFQSNNYIMEAGLQFLCKRLEKFPLSGGPNHEIFIFLHNACNSHDSIIVVMYCLKAMLHLCSNSYITLSLQQTEALFQKFVSTSNYGVGCSSIALSVVSCLIVRNQDDKDAKLMAVQVVIAIHKKSLPNNSEEIRLQTVRTLISFLPLIQTYQKVLQNEELEDLISEEIVSSLLNTALLLLQDENVEVRTEVAKFVSRLIVIGTTSSSAETILNPNKCISLLLTRITSFLPLRKAVKLLWEQSTNTLTPQELKKHSQLQYIRNPFDHGIENVFAEKVVITKCSGDILKDIIKCGKYDIHDIKSFLLVASSNLFETADSLISKEEAGDKLQENAAMYHTFLSVKYRLEVAILLKMENATALKSLLSELETASSNIYGHI